MFADPAVFTNAVFTNLLLMRLDANAADADAFDAAGFDRDWRKGCRIQLGNNRSETKDHEKNKEEEFHETTLNFRVFPVNGNGMGRGGSLFSAIIAFIFLHSPAGLSRASSAASPF